MSFIADVLLIAGALGAALYCMVLSSRLRRFSDLEKGVGGAVAVLSVQVDDLKKSLDAAQQTAESSVGRLADVSTRAETAAQRLELLIASLHDVQERVEAPAPAKEPPNNPFFVGQAARKGAS